MTQEFERGILYERRRQDLRRNFIIGLSCIIFSVLTGVSNILNRNRLSWFFIVGALILGMNCMCTYFSGKKKLDMVKK